MPCAGVNNSPSARAVSMDSDVLNLWDFRASTPDREPGGMATFLAEI